MEPLRTYGTAEGRAKAGQTKSATTKREIVAKLIDLVETEYSDTGTGMNVTISRLKDVASPPTIRRHFPGGIPEIAIEAVRLLSTSGRRVNPHLDALASMPLHGNETNVRAQMMTLRLSRIPLQPDRWTDEIIEEARSLLESLTDTSLPLETRARLHYLSAQYSSRRDILLQSDFLPEKLRHKLPKDPKNEVANQLELSRNLYLRAGEQPAALQAHIELRNYRLTKIDIFKKDPEQSDILTLYRDCLAMQGVDFNADVKVWLRLQEGLYARNLGLSDSSISDIFVDALSLFHGVRQDFDTYAMSEIQKLFLLAAQIGAITSQLADEVPVEALYAIGSVWFLPFGSYRLRHGRNLVRLWTPIALLLLKDLGIAPTPPRIREFKLLLLTTLGLTYSEMDTLFQKHDLIRDDQRNSDRESAPETATAVTQLVDAVKTLLAAPPNSVSLSSALISDAYEDLGLLSNPWAGVRDHRAGFEERRVLPRTKPLVMTNEAMWKVAQRAEKAVSNLSRPLDGAS